MILVSANRAPSSAQGKNVGIIFDSCLSYLTVISVLQNRIQKPNISITISTTLLVQTTAVYYIPHWKCLPSGASVSVLNSSES